MKKYFSFFLVLVFLMTGVIWSQESTEVVVIGYPLGVGGSVGNNFYQPYYADLKLVADFLHDNPKAKGIVTGGSDLYRYLINHDAKNPGLALGRANDLKRYMIETFGVDSTQLIVQTDEPSGKGKKYRYSSIRIEIPLVPDKVVDTTYLAPKIEVREFNNNYYLDNFGLNFGAGLSSSPYGGIPFISGAVVYKNQLHIEAMFGHTFWDNSRNFRGMSLDVWYRMAGGRMIYYPSDQTVFGMTAGWFRFEEISQDFYGYTRMSEGPVMGVRLHFLKFLNLSGEYFPHKERISENRLAATKDNSFLVSLSVNHYFGGGK